MTTVNFGKEVERELKRLLQPKSDGFLFISHKQLLTLPNNLLVPIKYAHILRLDCAYNRLTSLPSSIQYLTSLQQLWIHHNPLTDIAPEISGCKHLQVIDIHSTQVSEVPAEVALLSKLHTFDWRETPLAASFKESYQKQDTTFGLADFKNIINETYRRVKLKADLKDKLSIDYAHDLTLPDYAFRIDDIVERISEALPDVNDFGMFCRQANRLLPDRITKVTTSTPATVQDKLKAMQIDIARQRLAADVDIKIRCFYYDRIEREAATAILDAVYDAVKLLEDVQFFVAHAVELLPSDPSLATGEYIWNAIQKLQIHLTTLRENSIQALFAVLSPLYPEQEPPLVRKLAEEFSKVYQKGTRFPSKPELTKMAFLSAEASRVFPPDFGSIHVKTIIQKAADASNARK